MTDTPGKTTRRGLLAALLALPVIARAVKIEPSAWDTDAYSGEYWLQARTQLAPDAWTNFNGPCWAIEPDGAYMCFDGERLKLEPVEYTRHTELALEWEAPHTVRYYKDRELLHTHHVRKYGTTRLDE